MQAVNQAKKSEINFDPMSTLRKTKLLGPPEALEKAVSMLSKGACRDRTKMKNQVIRLARDFQHQSKIEKDARPRKVRLNLKLIAQDIERLGRTLRSIDELTGSELSTAGTGFPFFAELDGDEFFITADFNGLIKEDRGKASDWVVRLDALSKVIAFTQKNFNRRFPAKGGNKNLFREHGNSAKWELVNSAREVFEEFRPGKATGTEGGDFDEFVKAIFELAMGKVGEDHAKLSFIVKRVSNCARQLSRAEDEAFNLETERDGIALTAGKKDRSRLLKVKKITQRLLELSSLRTKLAAAIGRPE